MTRGFETVNLDEAPETVRRIVKIPTRATKGSAGYDFRTPYDVEIKPCEMRKIRTFIRAKMPKGEVLYLFIRSSLAIKQGLMLANAVGVIDSDYYGNADNGGEIVCAIFNASYYTRHLKAGERIAQGVFMNYLKADNDAHGGSRSGGVGSTGR